MWNIAQFIVIGLGAGILSGFFGIGGGLVVVPLLIWLAKMPTKTAMGTSLGALALPVTALGASNYFRAGHVDIKAALLVAAGIAIGSFVGSKIAQHVDGAWLQRAFSVLLVIVAVRMFLSAGSAGGPGVPPEKTDAAPKTPPAAASASVQQ